MEKKMKVSRQNKQYALWQILAIWALGGAPMWILGWIVHPALSQGMTPGDAGLLRIQLMTLGLIWQFLLAIAILYLEEGRIGFSAIRWRFWLNHPISNKTGQTNRRLWWWLIPFLLLFAVFEMLLGETLIEIWLNLFPTLAAPEGTDPSTLFAAESLLQWKGYWPLFFSFLAMGIFNTFLGEEFLFRGVLLPKMEGVFGRWDWVANGILFTLYHIHQPWTWLAILPSSLGLAFTGKHFRSNWFPIILHSAQTVIFLVLILGVVLGLA